MREMLEEKLKRFEELERQLVDPAVLENGERVAAVAREHGSLAKLATKYRTFKRLNGQIAEANEMIAGSDAEMRELAESELPELREQRDKLWDELLEMTIGGEDATRSRCMLEIRAGTGGDEAALFARDLYEMYKRYAETMGWKIEIMEMNSTELGGFKELILGVDGEGAFRQLQYEGGGHRVQRVPETEAKGRIQTSLATVAVMPEPEDVEIDLKPDDYRRDTFAASGPGGQHVNKTASAVRLTHYETGIVVSCQDEKSQHKNRAKAMRVLRGRILEAEQARIAEEKAEHRRTLVGSGDRSDRIRTYNFPQGRVTDHRIGLTLYKIDQIMLGQLDELIDAMLQFDREEKLRGGTAN
ncbi:MAG: peptide chain release factor 1 [Planctomycetaceae bacterium]|nr:peptide chain release factor 1 [Planctomycetaceae bacterium]